MERELEQFLAAYREKPWSPGVEVDCCLALAEWAIWLGYPDPAQHLRGAYDSEEGFRAIVERAGNVPAVVAPCVERIHGKPLQRPRCGAIGVIGSAVNIHRQFGAIHDGERWNVRFKNGVGFMTAASLAIWMI